VDDIVRKLRRHDTFVNMPDMLVISMYDQQLGEVAAFEELIGSHGGVGGEQEHPFLVVPSSWSKPTEPLLGAPVVHNQLVRWMEEVGAR
jgi:putative membrane protein